MKVVTTVADGTATVDLDPARHPPSILPLVEIDGRPIHHEPLRTLGPHQVPNQEALVSEHRLQAAKRYARANRLDKLVGAPPGAPLGIVCAGKTYRDLLQAFADLGVAQDAIAAAGVRVLKLATTYPLVEDTLEELARSTGTSPASWAMPAR